MATTTLTSENFDQTISQDGIVLVDFWATWCPPCRAFGPVFEAASEKHQDLVFGKIDTDAETRIAGSLGITSIPTLQIYKNGELVFNQAGALPARALEDVIQRARELAPAGN